MSDKKDSPQKKHGGARPGAGRPRRATGASSARIMIRLTLSEKTRLEVYAALKKISISEASRQFIRAGLEIEDQ